MMRAHDAPRGISSPRGENIERMKMLAFFEAVIGAHQRMSSLRAAIILAYD